MIDYLCLLDRVLTNGTPRHGEKPEGTLSVFGEQIKFNFEDGFPLITCRDMTGSWKRIIVPEILWMISGSTSAREAEEKFGLKLWNRWAEDSEKKLGTPPGELGPVYGHQLRHWNGRTDQLVEVVEMLKRTPETRRAEISLWNIEDVETGGIKKVNVANCIDNVHLARMNYKLPNGGYEERLDMSIKHRSVDLPAGAPHDWANWALFQMMVAKYIGIKPGTLTAHIDDAQIYDIQMDHVKELLKREPMQRGTVTIDDSPSGTIYDHKQEDFKLENYQAHPKMIIPTAT